VVNLEGKIYSCKHCKTHLATYEDIISKVLSLFQFLDFSGDYSNGFVINLFLLFFCMLLKFEIYNDRWFSRRCCMLIRCGCMTYRNTSTFLTFFLLCISLLLGIGSCYVDETVNKTPRSLSKFSF
jgi:hypothetical protein